MSACPSCRTETPAGTLEKLGGLCRACLSAFALEGAESGEADRTLPLPVGTTFRNLDILEVLGWGGMGVVYKCRQRDLNRLVALKVLNPTLASDEEFSRRFNGEARALAALNHANIVQVHEFGREGDLYFLVMEHVDGTSLRQAIAGKRLAPPAALQIVTQICVALEYAHQRGVIHRDIKPENILLNLQGDVKIADFGLAKILGEPEAFQTVTRADLVMGTPNYVAPEQMARKSVDHRADIYSLGVVFYEMLTGEVPMGRFAPPSKRVEVDVRLDEVVLKALEQEPGRRYQRASEMKTDVDILRQHPAGRENRRVLLTLSLIVMASGVVTAGYFLLRPRPKTDVAVSPPPPALTGIAQWSWVNRGEVAETAGDELMLTPYRDRPLMFAVPKGHSVSAHSTVRFRIRYDVHPSDEPWIMVLFDCSGPGARRRGLVLFPEGDHTAAFIQIEVPGNMTLLERQPLPNQKLVKGKWYDIEIAWNGFEHRIGMKIDGEPAFEKNLPEHIDLAGTWRFGFGGAAKEVRIKSVNVSNFQ